MIRNYFNQYLFFTILGEEKKALYYLEKSASFSLNSHEKVIYLAEAINYFY